MDDVAKIICGECGGKCCSQYPVWYRDEMGRINQNPTGFDLDNNSTWVMPVQSTWNYKDNKYAGCYYHKQGGCPEDKKADVCKHWYCDIWDEFTLGRIKDIHIGSQAEWITRYILWRLSNEDPAN